MPLSERLFYIRVQLVFYLSFHLVGALYLVKPWEVLGVSTVVKVLDVIIFHIRIQRLVKFYFIQTIGIVFAC